MSQPWHEALRAYPLDWLLEADNPSARYGALTQLVGAPAEAPEVRQAQAALQRSPTVQALIDGQHQDGHWGQPMRFFADFYTGTAWRWLLLLELGVDPQHPALQRAAHFLVETAYHTRAGGFFSHAGADPIWCYTGWLLWGLLRCGLAAHTHVQASIDWINETLTFYDGDDSAPDPDNGCLGRHTCIRAIVPVLRALAQIPPEARSAATAATVAHGVAFVLAHQVYKRSHNPEKVMNVKLTQLTFPGFYYIDFVDILQVLADLDVRDQRMTSATAYLRRKQCKDGTWKLQRQYNERSGRRLAQTVVDLGERGAANKWVTLKALVALGATTGGS